MTRRRDQRRGSRAEQPLGVRRTDDGRGWSFAVEEIICNGPHRIFVIDRDATEPGTGDDAVLVAQSLGAFTAPLVAAQSPLAELVFVNAMIPRPGERPGEWWGNTRSEQARRAAAERGGYSPDFDLETYFLHDVPPDVAAAGAPYQREEADAAFGSVCGFEAWPAIPIRSVAGVADRFFPVDFQRELAHARLGIEADVLPGGHLVALSQPEALTSYLLTRPAT